MNCAHCGDPIKRLSKPWHLRRDSSLPELRVGSLVVAKKASGVCNPGERGVVYDRYELGGRPGWSVIFQSGQHDRFSPCEVDFFLDVSGEVCKELTGYTFQNVLRLMDDFDRGDFSPALGARHGRAFFGYGLPGFTFVGLAAMFWKVLSQIRACSGLLGFMFVGLAAMFWSKRSGGCPALVVSVRRVEQ